MSARFVEQIEYRPLADEDLDAVAALERTLYEYPWTRANFADSLTAGYSTWACAWGDVLVGYAVMMVVLDEAHLLNISIHRDWQRRGHGRRFLDHLNLVARRVGARSMFLEVRPSNDAARALYQYGNFRLIGVRRGYYPAAHGREDALVLKRDL